MRLRVVTATALVVAAVCLLQACNGRSPVPSAASMPKTQLTSPLGVVSLKSTTAEVVMLSGSAPGASSSPRFHVAPHAKVAYVWSYPVSKVGSSFHVSLLSHSLGGWDVDELVHVGPHGAEGPLGSRSWRNDGKQIDGRQVFPDACTVKAAAAQSPWSLILLIGGHSQLKFASSALGFSFSYDPAVCGLNAVDVSLRMAKILKVEAGTGASVFEEGGGYGFTLIATKNHSQQQSEAELKAMTSGRPGRRGMLRAIRAGRASGFEQVVANGSTATIFMVLSAESRDYLLVGFYDTRRSRQAHAAFSRLVGTVRFMP